MFNLIINSGVARLTLDRPEARNAIPVAQWRPLGEAAREAEAGGAMVLVLQGGGSAFCAGADLKDFPAMHRDPAAAAEFRQAMRDGIEAFAALAIPTVALIGGPCFGAGVALAMACDLRFAGAQARFAITPAKYGISYPQEDVARLVRLVGPGQAARLLLGAGTIDAAEAMRIGLVDGGIDKAEPFIAATLASSQASIASLKRGIALAAGGRAQDEEQDRTFDTLIAGDELAAKLSALRPKR
ncbi:MAG TPA: enoyl-CoA hydratase/isomerase family protein [Allosphingosinicella sp.]